MGYGGIEKGDLYVINYSQIDRTQFKSIQQAFNELLYIHVLEVRAIQSHIVSPLK